MEVAFLRDRFYLGGYDKNPASKYLSIGLFQIKESLSHLLSTTNESARDLVDGL
jgi:hypothetical protein